eukprot:CAMPEP_0117425130 /NCGR_PEP_ID=MMETSP0758-20121206/5438_1 /TAXON_ID=63605 /ORGANISM="Percolomonas cosmopolitus, Strain AE-1 (ATCC 50343)" /LENGTH=456 /DNA_ID=CAMNT_0005209379 /DNA_START=38 /DNA_END=1408 /DNA_ORIENTATION=-
MTSEQMAIEDNYIKNLQQQVQFLEMELQLQQKVNAEHQQSVFAGAAPLDDTVNTLKMTFIQQSKEFRERIANLEAENKSLKHQLAAANSHIRDLEEQQEEERRALETSFNNEKTKLRAEIVANEKQIEHLQREGAVKDQEIERLAAENDKLAKENSEHKHRENDRNERLRAAKNDAEDAKYKLESYKQETERTLERAKEQIEAFKAADEEIRNLRRQVSDLKSDLQNMELRLKRADVEKSQLEAAKAQTQQMCEQEAQKNIDLSQQFNEQEKALNDANTTIDNMKKQLQKLENANLVMEEEQKSRHAKYREYEKRLSLIQETLDTKHKENQNMEEEIRHLQQQLENSIDELKSHESFYNEMNDNDAALRLDNRKLKDALMELEAMSDVRDRQTRDLKREISDLKTANERMKKQLQLADLLKALKETDFTSLLKTNMTVSSQIKDLMTFLPAIAEEE